MRIVGNQQLSVGEKTTGYQFHIDLCSFDDADDGNTNDIENNNFNIAYGAARTRPTRPQRLQVERLAATERGTEPPVARTGGVLRRRRSWRGAGGSQDLHRWSWRHGQVLHHASGGGSGGLRHLAMSASALTGVACTAIPTRMPVRTTAGQFKLGIIQSRFRPLEEIELVRLRQNLLQGRPSLIFVTIDEISCTAAAQLQTALEKAHRATAQIDSGLY